MRALLGCLLALLAGAAAAAGPVREVTAQQWDRPRSGGMVRTIPAIRAIVLDLRPGVSLAIRYPGGEQGLLWAEELKGWLVSLGVASARIRLVAGAPRPDALELMPETDGG